MHQHPRPSPAVASPALSPRTNPTRTNNPRIESPGSSLRAGSDTASYNDGDDGSEGSGIISGPSKDAIKKMDQIIQNFYIKAALITLQARMPLKALILANGTRKVNKWFQIETDDIVDFKEELDIWRTCGAGIQNRPPPLIIETYLDASVLTGTQSLVLVDDDGKRWDVLDALNSQSSASSDNSTRSRKRNNEVVLERWKIELRDTPDEPPYDLASSLPTVYKKCIIFFRSLCTTSKFLPARKLMKALKSGATDTSLRLSCRVMAGEPKPIQFDALNHPLCDNGSPVVSSYFLGTTDTPAGQFSAEVKYRLDCNFRVDDSNALLSSRFMGANEDFFQPSLGIRGDDRHRTTRPVEVGSLPTGRQSTEDLEPIQAYGSLSTFHGTARPGASSPISALRAQKAVGSDADTDSSPMSSSPRARPTMPLQASRSSLRSVEGVNMARRLSISFQPFKAGSLSSSPGRVMSQQGGEVLPPQSPQSLPRMSGISALNQARNRSSLTAGMPATLRGGPAVPDNAPNVSSSSSPKPNPITRYSSSFSHRRGRSSFGGASKIAVDDDQGSSGKQSLSSSVQPGSGVLAEGAGGSSGSLQTDDDQISEFLKLLDSKKTLQSFEPSGEASTKRTSAQLSKFQSMRESNNALTESMSSSTLLHRSSSSSSRQLSSVPPMVAANSMSVSSSPGKPVSPHTPHTPAIPSRLSANSVAEYSAPRISGRARTAPTVRAQGADGDSQASGVGTNAIDIPTSPRTYYPHTRRSSSVAQQHRILAAEDEIGDIPFGVHRSISLGADDREPPSLSALRALDQASDNVAEASSPSPSRMLQPAPHISESSAVMSRQASSSIDPNESEAPQIPRGLSAGSANSPYRPRIGRTGGRGVTPPQTGSFSSLDRASGSERSERGAGRQSFTKTAGTYEADDDLLFDMSEIGRDQSRRSIEEPRGGYRGTSNERGGFDSSRGGDSSTSSRRGSRRW